MTDQLGMILDMINERKYNAVNPELIAIAKVLFEHEICGNHSLTQAETCALYQATTTGKLECIKMFKTRNECCLTEAKQFVESVMMKEFGVTHFNRAQ